MQCPGKAQAIPATPLADTGLPSDERRAQELDQYYAPSNKSSLRLTERDSALPAHMQLICWRLGMRRALVSLINRDTQYYVAESTKTMDLHDPSRFEHADDGPMAFNASHPSTGTLCAETIKAVIGSTEEPAYFEICDLTADKRFSHLNIVGGLHRYYCGVPIRTSNKIVIGTVFVLDDKVRKPLELQHLQFLTSMADNVMVHLENRRQQMDVVRIMKMNKSLASFMDSNQDRRSQTPPEEPNIKEPDFCVPNERGSRRNSPGRSSEDELPQGNSGREYSQIFSRASTLLRQSLSLQETGGGVLFLDTASRSTGRHSAARRSSQREGGRKRNSGKLAVGTAPPSRTASDDSGSGDDKLKIPAAILAYNGWATPSGDPDQTCQLNDDPPFEIPVKSLLKFIKKAPGGQVYHFPELRDPCTGELQTTTLPSHHGTKDENDLRTLFSHLPGAYNLIMVPLWNTHLGRWSVCMVYTLSIDRSFTFEIDYLFCRAFCNCVKAEIDRCTVMLSDQQKGDFIGSVSHELRSPLHGILASCELISETELSPFQISLIDTTKSCSHTLLDTIQMVLDFSKVNAFKRDRPGERLNLKPHVVKGGVEPLLSTYSHVNVAAIAEEVIEGVTTGHLAKTDPSLELGFSGERSKRDPKTFDDLLAMPQSPVEVILDVSPPQDWTFITQPGAYRRIIMNVFGNSLKYTEHGFIKVSLNCEDIKVAASEPPAATVELQVSDSGKGISQAYMDTKMFTPFAQENSLAPGTGLGLSLVRSLVQMMHGEIDIQSEVNVGTTVTVKIPMKRAGSQDPQDAFHRPNEGDIQALRNVKPRPRIVNFQQDVLPDDTESKREGYQMQKHALAACINGWYKVEDLDDWDTKVKPDIVLVDDVHLLDVTKQLKVIEDHNAVVVVLCSDRSRTMAISRSVDYPKLHVMAKPFGPFKLARALKHALDKRRPEYDDSVAAAMERTGPVPKVKRSNATLRSTRLSPQETSREIGSRKTSFDSESSSFPFPTMTVSISAASRSSSKSPPTSETPTPSNPSPTPRLEAPGTHRRRLKTLDVPLFQQRPVEKHDELQRSHSDSEVIRAQHMSRKPKILLVDDNEVNLKLLQTYFVRREYKDMKLARDGSEAVQFYEDALRRMDPFHLVFMDVSMPVMDGFEATRIIRQIEASMSAQRTDQPMEAYRSLIIALTGNASAEDQANAFTNGMDMYMTKPVSLKDIGALMKAWEEKSSVYGVHGARDGLLEGNASAGE
ncbi:hypothetical protein D6C77_08631 [Aureobasidium pullulans]|uniref:Uncharacterized protein n=1 Tax=Aureobasidium pullulans TaxID=5580 RepID=A0AB74JKA7_AURPU|nr:hypothetical protein D6D12_08148 [Aureobasidium pullulans]THX45787.1 hypothetical protein D6D11_07197 [Aureobasidium pullulans]TIA52107.1 hypothetical protein D6C77_08631 [Aureobasidium pullulans]